MACTIYLHGKLRKKFGPSYTLAVRTPGEAVHALCCLRPEIEGMLREGAWRVVRGKLQGGRRLGPEELGVNLGSEMHILAAARGAKSGAGVGKIILGVVLIAAAVFTGGAAAAGGSALFGTVTAGATATGAASASWAAATVGVLGANISMGSIALFGAAMVLGGVSALLAPTPAGINGNTADTKPSYLFSGQMNNTDQGVPIPFCFGKMRVPGIVISLGLDTVDIAT